MHISQYLRFIAVGEVSLLMCFISTYVIMLHGGQL